MAKQELIDIVKTQCSICSGKGEIREFVNEEAVDREDDKLPSGHLANVRSENRGFLKVVRCDACDGSGYFLEPIYE